MSEVLNLLIDRIDTPIGELLLVADHDGNVRAIDWTDHEERMLRLLRLHYGKDGFRLEPASNPSGLGDVIRRYFAGELAAIDSLPVKTAGTAFQREVWCGCARSTVGRQFLTRRWLNGLGGLLR